MGVYAAEDGVGSDEGGVATAASGGGGVAEFGTEPGCGCGWGWGVVEGCYEEV